MKKIVAGLARERISLLLERAITAFLKDRLLEKYSYVGWDVAVTEATQSKKLEKLGFKLKYFVCDGKPHISGWHPPKGAKIYAIHSLKAEASYYWVYMKDGKEFMVRFTGGIRHNRPLEKWYKGSVQLMKKPPACIIGRLSAEVLHEFDRIFDPWLKREIFS